MAATTSGEGLSGNDHGSSGTKLTILANNDMNPEPKSAG
jgi:hypothetical protein